MLLRLLEQPYCGGAEKRQQRSPAKNIHVRPQRRLLHELPVHQAIRARTRRSAAELVREIAADLRRLMLQRGV